MGDVGGILAVIPGIGQNGPLGARLVLLFLFGSVSRVRCVSCRIVDKYMADLANRRRPGNLSEKYRKWCLLPM